VDVDQNGDRPKSGGETVQNLGAYWPSVRPEDRESGMIRDRDDRPALLSSRFWTVS
jgi:hypothetical protein